MTLKTLLICDASDEKRQEIEQLVKSHPDLELIGAASRQGAAKNIAEMLPRLVWIELSPEPMKALTLLGDLREQYPAVQFLVSNETLDASLVKTSMQLGAADFLDAKTWRDQMPDVIKRVMAKDSSAQAQPAPQAPQRPEPKPGGFKLFGRKEQPAATAQPAPQAAQPAATAQPAPASAPMNTPQAAEPQAESGGGKWGDLDSIPTPGATQATTEMQPQIEQSESTTESESQNTAGSKWGDLDSIPTPGAGAISQSQDIAAPAQDVEPPATTDAAAAAEPEAFTPEPAPAPEPEASTPEPAPEPEAFTPEPAPAPEAFTPEPAPAPEPEAASQGKWGDLDAIPSPGSAQSQSISAEPEPSTQETVQTPDESSSNKWGNLDEIPTPKETTRPTETAAAPKEQIAAQVKEAPVRADKQLSAPVPEGLSSFRAKSPDESAQTGSPAWLWLVIFGLFVLSAAMYMMYR